MLLREGLISCLTQIYEVISLPYVYLFINQFMTSKSKARVTRVCYVMRNTNKMEWSHLSHKYILSIPSEFLHEQPIKKKSKQDNVDKTENSNFLMTML